VSFFEKMTKILGEVFVKQVRQNDPASPDHSAAVACIAANAGAFVREAG